MKKAYAIIIRNGLILLVRRPGVLIWELPGGQLLPNEGEREGIKRMIDEDLGFKSEILELVGIYSKESEEDITYVYTAKEAQSQSNMDSHMYVAFSFFDIHNLPLNIFFDQKRQIRDYLSGKYPVRLRLKESKLTVWLKTKLKQKKK
ncbi:NUDIX domain-containing protein [Enterococcus florum]|uniref:NUDIX domain-containing protein n=1 Tax=Enterococcus florum TaxID=2480627 RepID=UPI0011BADE97|nr:NUDIX domain-containing protein [Enterococcus florum]